MYSYKHDIVQLFYLLNRKETKRDIQKFASFFESLVSFSCIYVNSDLFNMILKLVLYTRDILYGKGERSITYMMIHILYKYYPVPTLSLIRSLVYPIDKSRPPYGSWRDMKHICSYIRNLSPGVPIQELPLIRNIIQIINSQLFLDSKKKHTEPLSLVAKWIPREKSNHGWLFYELAIHWAKKYTPYLFSSSKTLLDTSILRRNRLCYSNYRKIVAKINRLLDTVEIKLCSRNYDKIIPEKINIGTLVKQYHTFFSDRCSPQVKHYFLDETISSSIFDKNSYCRNKSYKVPLSFLVKEAIQLSSHIEKNNNQKKEFLHSIWKNYKQNCFPLENIIPVIDISLSMNESDMTPYYNAIGLGCLIANQSSLKNRMITIDHQPSWINLDGSPDFVSMIDKVVHFSKGGTVSNLFESIELIIQSILITNMSPEQVGKMVFVILSDMKYIHSIEETQEKIDTLFRDAGLKSSYKKAFVVPHIVYWNLSHHFLENLPCKYNSPRVSVVSGCSQSLLNDFCFFGSSSYFDEFSCLNPYNIITSTL